jgi:trehalose 6-phosphate synthase/phosphatase
MDGFTDRVPGSWVEHKQINIAWHFRAAEREYADEQAKELVLQLESLKLPIDVLRGKKTIEVRPRGINKGTVVKALLNQYRSSDFILCVGDDRTDEDMFDALDAYPGAFTVMVDRKPTHAKFYLDRQSDVVRLLSMLVNVPYEGSPGRGSPRHYSIGGDLYN